MQAEKENLSHAQSRGFIFANCISATQVLLVQGVYPPTFMSIFFFFFFFLLRGKVTGGHWIEQTMYSTVTKSSFWLTELACF